MTEASNVSRATFRAAPLDTLRRRFFTPSADAAGGAGRDDTGRSTRTAAVRSSVRQGGTQLAHVPVRRLGENPHRRWAGGWRAGAVRRLPYRRDSPGRSFGLLADACSRRRVSRTLWRSRDRPASLVGDAADHGRRRHDPVDRPADDSARDGGRQLDPPRPTRLVVHVGRVARDLGGDRGADCPLVHGAQPRRRRNARVAERRAASEILVALSCQAGWSRPLGRRSAGSLSPSAHLQRRRSDPDASG